jgi:Arc/MetJ-type ribon-helix-helix transcriptional regulator
MVRTQIYLTEEELAGLRALAQLTGRTQSELIRRAVDRLLGDGERPDRLATLRRGRGTDLPEGADLRREWDRGGAAGEG